MTIVSNNAELVEQICKEAELSLFPIVISNGKETVTVRNHGTLKAQYSHDSVCVEIPEDEIRTKIADFPAYTLHKVVDKISATTVRYENAKERLLDIAERLTINTPNKLAKLQKVIEKVCVPFEHVGFGNHFKLNSYTKVRLGDAKNGISGPVLYLQEVMVQEYDGTFEHFYPDKTEEEILLEILATF